MPFSGYVAEHMNSMTLSPSGLPSLICVAGTFGIDGTGMMKVIHAHYQTAASAPPLAQPGRR
jgi:hypothetical protein